MDDCFGVPSLTPAVPAGVGRYDASQVTPICEAAIKAFSSIVVDVMSPILEHLESISRDYQQLLAQVMGPIHAATAAADDCIGDCVAKIKKPIQRGMSTCYGDACSLGMTYPMPDAVVTGLQTGKYIDSVKWYRPLDAQDLADYVPQTGPDSQYDRPPDRTPDVTPTTPVTPAPVDQSTGDGVTRGVGVRSTTSDADGRLAPSVRPLIDAAKAAAAAASGTQPIQSGGPRIPSLGTLTDAAGRALDFIAPQPIKDAVAAAQDFVDPRPDFQVVPSAADTDLGNAPDWSNPMVCAQLAGARARASRAAVNFEQAAGLGKTNDGQQRIPRWFAGIYAALPSVLKPAAVNILESLAGLATKMPIGGSGSDACNPGRALVPTIVAVLSGFLEQYAGPEAARPFAAYRYWAHAECPQNLPFPESINRGFLGGTINETEWECLTSANDMRPTWQKKILEADRSRPNALSVIMLHKRGKITVAERDKRLRDLGYLLDEDREREIQGVQADPGIDDVIRFMVRDVFNSKVIADFGYDQGFDANYTGQAKKYGEAIGLPETLARDYWRAHWFTPSNTQLFEMLHRNRPGRVDPSLVVTADMVERALQINDILPFWAKRLISISFSPLTRTDVQRAFFIGTLKRADVLSSYLDLGYSPENAEKLTQFTEELKRRRQSKSIGLPTARELSTLYARSEITEQELDNSLDNLGFSEADKDLAKGAAHQRRVWRRRKAALVVLRKRYNKGEITWEAVVNKLVEMGMAYEDWRPLADAWRLETDTREKHGTAAQACHWRGLKLIDEREQATILLSLGYSRDAVERIVKSCEVDLSDKALKKLSADMGKLQRQRDREGREATAKAKDAARKRNIG